MLERRVVVARERLEARGVVRSLPASGIARERVGDERARLVDPARRRGARTRRRSPPTPTAANALPGFAPTARTTVSSLGRDRLAQDAGPRVHERPGRRVERLVAERERRARRARRRRAPRRRPARGAARSPGRRRSRRARRSRRTAGSRACGAAAAASASPSVDGSRSRSSSERISVARRSSRAQLREHDRVDPLDAVDALLEVLGAGPGGERALELAVVAEPREPLAASSARSSSSTSSQSRRGVLPKSSECCVVQPRELGDRMRRGRRRAGRRARR